MNIFELASRNKSRFPTNRGHINVEQLWEVPVASKDGFDLEAIAQQINSEIEKLSTGSILGGAILKKDNDRKTLLEAELEIVKRVYAVKTEEAAAVLKKREKGAQRQRILEAISVREEGDLKAKSKEELLKELAALDEE